MSIKFKGNHFERGVILWGYRWYVAYPISYRQLEEMMEERGVAVDHSTLNRWVLKYAPLLEKEFRAQEMFTWGSSIRWVLRLIETGMPSGVAGVDVMEISRPDGASNIADLGLTLSEAKQLLACVQQTIVAAQRETSRLGGRSVRIVAVGVTSTAGDAICSQHRSAR